ncbi:hypothetical protein BGX33_007666 [Mortierella sp. NVP41]|nr:hypothetical protein BGX33_007666 [Mortierella sp. NVP41]
MNLLHHFTITTTACSLSTFTKSTPLFRHVKAANNIRLLPIRHISDRPRNLAEPLPTVVVSESGPSETQPLDKASPPLQTLAVKNGNNSGDDSVRGGCNITWGTLGIWQVIDLAGACRYIEDLAEQACRDALVRLEEELHHKVRAARGQGELTATNQSEIRRKFNEKVQERRLQIRKGALEKVLKAWKLSDDQFDRLKQVRLLRNALVHPTLGPEEVAIILENWIQGHSQL